MELTRVLKTNDLILMEAAIIESLKRSGKIVLHPELVNALLIYDEVGRIELTRFFDDYIGIARRAGVPIMICTSTWRANRQRIKAAGAPSDINADAVAFLRAVQKRWEPEGTEIYAGGLMGCKNDAYRPKQSLHADAAAAFHGWQAERLAAARPDFLMAATLPALSEARGMARAMAATGIPYIISFVINKNGNILDQTPLAAAFSKIDSAVDPRPLGYMVNCAYPTFLNPGRQPESVFSRLIGYQANASALSHDELDSAGALQAEPVSDWGGRMIELNRCHGVKILGGCCGTGREHLAYIADHMTG